MSEFWEIWFVQLGWLLGGTWLFSVLLRGGYYSLRHIANYAWIQSLEKSHLIDHLADSLWAASCGFVCFAAGLLAFDFEVWAVTDTELITKSSIGLLSGLLLLYLLRNFDIDKDSSQFTPQDWFTLGKMSLLGVFGVVTVNIVAGIGGIMAMILAIQHGNHLSAGMARMSTWWFKPLMILIKFRTILCQSCFQYTLPLNARYTYGTRYCEHCNHVVDATSEPGRLIFLFGIILDKPKGERVFLVSNPDVETRERPFDVSEVYIDTNTCNIILLERFLTHIMVYPPKHGLQSVTIFYRGNLDTLNKNIQNALRNNFTRVQRVAEEY